MWLLKQIKGVPNQMLTKPVLGRISKNKCLSFSKHSISLSATIPLLFPQNALIIMPEASRPTFARPIVRLPDNDFKKLNEGDILLVEPDGTIKVLWEESSGDNVLFITDFCNSKCIMCPQSSCMGLNSYINKNMKIIELVKDISQLKTIGITGGEPTFEKEDLLQILKLCKKKFPATSIAMLTNGKNFDDFDFAKACALANANITYCIPLYASYSEMHDFIVGNPGSFQRTINGIYNLIRLKRPIEIRIVILKQNYKELPLLIEYIYQNIPFVVHVALMGMEISGSAACNSQQVWVDPLDYMAELRLAVLALKRNNLPFSIYNIPLCLLPKNLWSFAKDSISSWKKVYLQECDSCSQQNLCGGLFQTSYMHSRGIKPIS